MECQICYEHYDSKSFIPKILVKCGHSFCKICLDVIMNKKTNIQCPICRENTKIGKKEVLPTNYSLVEIIERETDTSTIKSVLEKYKYFDEKFFRNINPVLVRYHEPKKLVLKRIHNDDFIYVEEYESNQNFSLMDNLPRRNRRYNFNRHSLFGYFLNEYSNNIYVFKKASKCKHSFSCLEHILRKVFMGVGAGLITSYVIKLLLKYKSNDNSSNTIIKFLPGVIGASVCIIDVINCLISSFLDQALKIKN